MNYNPIYYIPFCEKLQEVFGKSRNILFFSETAGADAADVCGEGHTHGFLLTF
jgi:hypothetical protein